MPKGFPGTPTSLEYLTLQREIDPDRRRGSICWPHSEAHRRGVESARAKHFARIEEAKRLAQNGEV